MACTLTHFVGGPADGPVITMDPTMLRVESFETRAAAYERARILLGTSGVHGVQLRDADASEVLMDEHRLAAKVRMKLSSSL
jgi:hypothetical protein